MCTNIAHALKCLQRAHKSVRFLLPIKSMHPMDSLGYVGIILELSLLKEVSSSSSSCLVEIVDTQAELIKVEPTSLYKPSSMDPFKNKLSFVFYLFNLFFGKLTYKSRLLFEYMFLD